MRLIKTVTYYYVFILSLIFNGNNLMSQTPYSCDGDRHHTVYAGKNLSIFKDQSAALSFNQVKNIKGFVKSDDLVPNLGFIKGNVWVKIQVENRSTENSLFLELDAPLIDEVELYYELDSNLFCSELLGQTIEFYDRKYNQPVYVFDLPVSKNSIKTFYLRIRSVDQIELPIRINTRSNIFFSISNKNFLFGIYSGMMIIMILYNMFIYFSVKDKSYFIYVVYIFTILLTQATFQGFTFKYLWPYWPEFEVKSIHLMSILVGFSSVQFLRVFLQTKKFVPKYDFVFLLAFVFYAFAAILVVLGYLQETWILILCIVSPLSLFMLFVGIRVTILGNKSAKFFTIAWSVFLLGVFIFAMKDFGLLPHNLFTVYTMPIGSAIETVLLSFALAARINEYKKEKDTSNIIALQLAKENERIIKEQNMILELRVKERTVELEESNRSLKETEAILVNAEKMASLGQLTAGISHEINNPINFVVSNVKPLQRDIRDILSILEKYSEIENEKELQKKLDEIKELKKKLDSDYLITEIDLLLKGISEGANRTSEIVKGLKNFARADEGDLKKMDIHEGINATLTLLNNSLINQKTEVKKIFGSIPQIDCYPGKINQVLMNLLSNSVHAIKSANRKEGGLITIETIHAANGVVIKITDNGTGIPKNIISKIFDPFYTTKDVGEGTGLGLSIVYGIIKSHNGTIEVESEENVFTTFIITLPLKQK